MAKILLLEDSKALSASLVTTLKMEGYEVILFDKVTPLISELPQLNFDLALLDLELSDGSGYNVCEQIRKLHRDLPIIIITAKASEEDAVKGLELGADDYIRKPFGNRELMARIKTCLRSIHNQSETSTYLGLTLYPDQLKVAFNDNSLELRRKEFEILSLLIKKKGGIATREEIIEFIDRGSEIFDRTIDSHVSHIRGKIRRLTGNAVQIASAYGLGYRLRAESE